MILFFYFYSIHFLGRLLTDILDTAVWCKKIAMLISLKFCHCLWPTCVLVIMWHQSSVLSTGFRSVNVYNTSAIWPHWHQLHRVGHIFALPTASPLTSLGRGQGWATGHCQSLVHVPGTHFRLPFAAHLVWTLLSSISKHICFLLPTIYNNRFTQFYSLFYTPGSYILVCSADHGLV